MKELKRTKLIENLRNFNHDSWVKDVEMMNEILSSQSEQNLCEHEYVLRSVVPATGIVTCFCLDCGKQLKEENCRNFIDIPIELFHCIHGIRLKYLELLYTQSTEESINKLSEKCGIELLIKREKQVEKFEKKQLKLYYNQSYKDDDTFITIEYYSKDEIYNEAQSSIKTAFKKYMNTEFDCKRDSIVDIVYKIRELTKGIREGKLEIIIKKSDYREWIEYINGYFESAGAYRTEWDDVIGLTANYKGINVTFKKDKFGLNSEDKVDLINEELKPFYDKIITLCNMTNTELNQIEQPGVYQKK